MSQDNKICEICHTLGHSKFYCKNKPFKPISKVSVKKSNSLEFDVIKKPKPNKPSRSKAKKDAWTAFATYIRLRDCLKTTGTTTSCVCVTCAQRGDVAPKECKHIQAGHAVGGRGNAVLFNEEITNGQCLTKESNIRLFNGSSKSISKLRVGDELWAFDKNTYSLEKSLVEKVNNFKPEKLYMVEMENGKIFYATDDHMLVSDGEWVSIKDILHNVSAYDILEL